MPLISNSLMSDPVIVTSSQTFERVSVAVCQNLGYTLLLPNGSTPDFYAVIPNLAFKDAICNWCSKIGSDGLNPPKYSDLETALRCSTVDPPVKGPIRRSE